MRDVRVLCRWPAWQKFRRALLESGKVDEGKLSEIVLTTEGDSLEMVEFDHVPGTGMWRGVCREP